MLEVQEVESLLLDQVILYDFPFEVDKLVEHFLSHFETFKVVEILFYSTNSFSAVEMIIHYILFIIQSIKESNKIFDNIKSDLATISDFVKYRREYRRVFVK